MRLVSLSRASWFLMVALLSVMLGVTACQSGSEGRLEDDDFESDIVMEPTAEAGKEDSRRQEAVAREAADHARALQAGMNESGKPAPALDARVKWLEVPRPAANTRPTVEPSIAQAPIALNEPPASTAAQTTAAAVIEPALLRPTVQAKPADRAELIRQLRATLQQSSEQPMTRGAQLAALAVLDPASPFDPTTLTELSTAQQERLQRYQKLLVAASQHLLQEDAPFDFASMQSRYEDALEQQPIGIRTAKLVRRVSSFGVYDEFTDHRFLSGRENPLIVYVELDDFQSREIAPHQFLVKLAQEIELYTDPAGTLVWSQPREELVDESRNRRRDFFVRQLIKLPANLSVGEYLIKVRVFDVNGGTVAERSVPIVLVADQRMVREK